MPVGGKSNNESFFGFGDAIEIGMIVWEKEVC